MIVFGSDIQNVQKIVRETYEIFVGAGAGMTHLSMNILNICKRILGPEVDKDKSGVAQTACNKYTIVVGESGSGMTHLPRNMLNICKRILGLEVDKDKSGVAQTACNKYPIVVGESGCGRTHLPKYIWNKCKRFFHMKKEDESILGSESHKDKNGLVQTACNEYSIVARECLKRSVVHYFVDPGPDYEPGPDICGLYLRLQNFFEEKDDVVDGLNKKQKKKQRRNSSSKYCKDFRYDRVKRRGKRKKRRKGRFKQYNR